MMYKYYSSLGFYPIKHNDEGKDIHNEMFNNIQHFIKNPLHVDCIQDDKVILHKRELIPNIPDSMIPVDFYKTTIHN